MRRSILALLMSVTVVAAACTAGPGETGSPDQPSITTTSPSGADAPTNSDSVGQSKSPSDTAEVTTDTRPLPEGEPALDFTLAIGADQTEQFMLSQEVKPVFMVFWAEW